MSGMTTSDWFTTGTFILDGGCGTQLQLRGLATGEHPDLWNLSQPEKVREVAEAYIQAGSDIILTNTFGSNRFLLTRYGAEDKTAELNRAGVRLSKEAAHRQNCRVFATMGPTGIMLMSGAASPEELYAAFLEQAEAIAAEVPDGIVVETMSDPAEAVLAVKAAKTTGLPVAACMVFDTGKNLDRTMMGTTPEQAVEQLTVAGADIIGANCGQGIDGFLPICRRMRAATAFALDEGECRTTGDCRGQNGLSSDTGKVCNVGNGDLKGRRKFHRWMLWNNTGVYSGITGKQTVDFSLVR